MKEYICLCLSESSLYSTWSLFLSCSWNYLNFLLLYGWIKFHFYNRYTNLQTRLYAMYEVHLYFNTVHKTFSGLVPIVATSMVSLRKHFTPLPGNHLRSSKVPSLLVYAEASCTSMPLLSTWCHSGNCSCGSLVWKTALNSYRQHQGTSVIVCFYLFGTHQPQLLPNSGAFKSALLHWTTHLQIVRIWCRIREKI